MALNVNELMGPMLEAVTGVFGKRWPKMRDYAEGETRKLAESLAQIAQLRVSQEISEDEARVLLEMQKNTARAVLLAVEGMGLLLAEQAINAALAAVRGTVNGALRFPLL
jgi:hypothetical protein